MVIAPANTGKESNNKNEVINNAQTYNGNLYIVIPGKRILKTVVIKLIAPKIGAAPETCTLKNAKSTLLPSNALASKNAILCTSENYAAIADDTYL
jgi:hypothetical protein